MLFSMSSILAGDDSFLRVVLLITCTVTVFILLITGTATTAISFPPAPLNHPCNQLLDSATQPPAEVKTALDGNYKLLGPLLIMAGGFLLILDVVLFAVIARDAYHRSKDRIRVSHSPAEPISLLGGPFYLAVPTTSDHSAMKTCPHKHLWAVPNAPTPDFGIDSMLGKASKIRPSSARCQQLPFNPDAAET